MVEISKLGIIGNSRSAALITIEGTIVWSCLPDFDSPSVFAKLLDEDMGGEMSIIPKAESKINQSYLENTNILSTIFETPSGSFELLDFMPLYSDEFDSNYHAPEIYRLLRVINGKPEITVVYHPMLNYANGQTISKIHDEFIKSITIKGEYHSIYLYSNLPFTEIIEEKPITLQHNSYLLISYHQKIGPVDYERALLEYERTKIYWINWVSRTKPFKLYQKEIFRSALTLKLLTYQKTGAVIAAVTTSLPEKAGDERNWDYRYCWIRDASMIISTLWEIKHKNTAKEFLRFLLNNLILKADTLQIVYGIRGEKKLSEKNLKHLTGYKKSRPIRIGNNAYKQKQNDIYGILMDLIYTGFIHSLVPINEMEELWTTVRYIMRTVDDNWRKPDRGIWEIRNNNKHFVFSKVLSWVAADRGIAIAKMLQRDEYIDSWTKIRESIRDDIEAKGWNESKQAYTQSYSSNDLDSSLLLIEQVGYCTNDNPRYVSTVHAVYEELCRNQLMYRYKNKDDFGLPGSAFVICTFWMIDSLYKIGEKEISIKMFDNLLSLSNLHGLLSEDLDFETGELLGNFPQGYSHLALINTAILLNGDISIDEL